MAITHGKEGGVYNVTSIAGTTINVIRMADTTNWSITTTKEFGEIRKHGADWVRRRDGIIDWSASVEMLLNMASNQSQFADRLMTPSGLNTIILGLFISDNAATPTATLPRWEGTAFVSGLTAGVPANDLQTFTVDFVGQGTLQYLDGP